MKRRDYLKSVLACAGTLVLFLVTVPFVYSQTTEQRVNEIKRIEAENNRLAEEADATEYSSVFVVELNVNRKENPYPAVGRYSTLAKFCYTYGDREKNPYPDRLLKISREVRRSAIVERVDLTFDKTGNLVLYAKDSDDTDNPSSMRLYFSAKRVIRAEQNGKLLRLTSPAVIELTRQATSDSLRLTRLFRDALE